MKIVVVYKSKTGFTKKYAEWISEELKADIFETSKVTIGMLKKHDTIIYGGSLYAERIIGVKLITKKLQKLKDKKIIVFAIGASPLKENVINEVKDKNFTPEQQKHIKFFYFRGGFNYDELNSFDKFLMTIMKKKIKNKKNEDLSDEEKGMIDAYDNPVDFTNKKDIEELIDYVNL